MEQNEVVLRAQEKESICVCMAKPQNGDKLIECHSEACNNGKFFHMSYLHYKQMPNNAKQPGRVEERKLPENLKRVYI